MDDQQISKVRHIDDIGKMLQELLDRHRKGEIQGLVVGVLEKNEGWCESYWSGLDYLERVGLAENLKTAIMLVKRGLL